MGLHVNAVKHRLTLELDDEAKKALQKVQTRTRAESGAIVIRRALALYDLVTEHNDEGGELIFKEKDGKQTTIKIL